MPIIMSYSVLNTVLLCFSGTEGRKMCTLYPSTKCCRSASGREAKETDQVDKPKEKRIIRIINLYTTLCICILLLYTF